MMSLELDVEHYEIRYALPEEIPLVIAMRSQAYQGTGKFERDGMLTDSYARIAHHLTAFYDGQPVASMRLMFHKDTDEWEQDRFFAWPDDFPARSQVVEISRTCVKREYRHTGIIQEVMKECAYKAIQSDREWIIASATKNLLKVYERVGCFRTNVSFSHQDLEMVEHTVFLGSVPDVLTGKAGKLLWLVFWQDIARRAYQNNILPFHSKVDLIRFHILCFLDTVGRPIIKLIQKKLFAFRGKK